MSKPPAGPVDRRETGTYEIRLQGHLDARWAARLGIPGLTHESDGTTTLCGISADQATLHGLLQRVRDIGLTLISINRIGAEPDRTGTAVQTSLHLSKTRTIK